MKTSFKLAMAACFVAGVLASCDVRNQDKMATATMNGQPVDTATAPPTTVNVIDTVHNFGQKTEGEIVEYSYRFKNTGTYPLVVSNVSASCGCTVPEKPEAPIKPGEMGFIKVKFNSEGRPGATHKTVTVLSNASPAFPELLLEGEVIAKKQQ